MQSPYVVVNKIDSTKNLGKIGAMTAKQAKSEESANKDSQHITIESRFGQVQVKLENAIFFPQGLLGLPDNLHFTITDVPRKNMGNFKLLQCLNDHSLSFVVLPLGLENPVIEKRDLEDCCKSVGIPINDLVVLLIASVQKTPESVRITVNARAPVVIDTVRKVAGQYVFPHNKYEICQPL